MKMRWIKLMSIGLLLLIHSVSLAQEEPELVRGMPPPAKTETGKITVDFKDADIHDVLKIISYKSEVNIVAGTDVSGTVTIRLVNVPWEQALDVILKTYGFVYEREGDVIRVTTLENLGKEDLRTQIFTLNYADAEEICESIKEILTDRGKVKFDERTNQAVVTDVPPNLTKIREVIKKLDRKTKQVMIEAKIIETVLDKDERLGIQWTLGAEVTGAARPLTTPFVFANTGGITGKKYFPKVDTTTSDFTGSVENGFPYAIKSDFTFGTLSFAQLQAVLEIFKRRANTKILSNPRITTLNNQEAVISVTETLNIPKYEVDSDTGRLVISGYSEKKVGITLTVTPQVNEEDQIVVELSPEVSSLIGWDEFSTGAGTIPAPRISTREATTQVMVKDGETIVIGGLIKEEISDTVRKVPILGDIPLLKYLFSKTTKEVDTTDLMIFVTVRLLNSESEDSNKQAKVDEE